MQFTRLHVDIAPMSDALANVVARSVRAERARRGLSQTELGARLGWSQTKVSQVESGARRIYADTVERKHRAQSELGNHA